MAGTTSESEAGKPLDGVLSGEALAEWRSSEQVENSIISTSAPFWDTDDEEDCGPKPSDLYGTFTWTIDNFSKINKREIRSNAFQAGSYKWYILIYPQGCDVCNHLSLFLCVANHDKLLPGWSQFAQFTIAVMNKDPKKTKYSDTLHRFWKKEHDWGWKKYMELSKVLQGGFVVNDQLIIKAQVQVIREKPDRPFRCLNRHYRRILVGVHSANVEDHCRRFVAEKKNKLVQLKEDKDRWSSFHAYWTDTDQSARQVLCREKADPILRAIVNQFFQEKDVSSTLLMDSLYSGLKALECRSKEKVGSKEVLNVEESSVVHLENNMFVLVDDVLKLLERASLEPLPPKDGKGQQNRLKEGCLEDSSKDFELRERRLTEIGRKTIEIFFLAHIFSKIEVTYQEHISFKRQEELIREEAVWLAEIKQRVKRGASEKEKKSKKKQAKQKRDNRKGKDKGKTEKLFAAIEDDLQTCISSDNKDEIMAAVADCLLAASAAVSDSVSCLPELRSPGSEEREASWDTDALESQTPPDASSGGVSGHSGVQRGTKERNKFSLADDSSSTCSTDSVPSVVMNGLYSGFSLPKPRNRKSLNRIKYQRGIAAINEVGYEAHNRQPEATSGVSKLIGAGRSGKAESQPKVAALSMNGRKTDGRRYMTKKEIFASVQREASFKGEAIKEKPFKEKTRTVPPSFSTPSKTMSSTVSAKPESKISGPSNPNVIHKSSYVSAALADRTTSVINTADSTNAVKVEAHKVIPKKSTNKPSVHPLPVVSRPLSAPVVPGPKPSTPIVSQVQTPQMLSRSMSVAGCLGPNTSPSYPPLSYRNAIMGITQSHSQISSQNPSQSHTQLSNSPSSDPSESHRQVSLSPGSVFNPSQSHTQVSHTPSSLLYPSQSHTQVSQSSSFNQSQLLSPKSSPPFSQLDPSNSLTQTPNSISASVSSPSSPERIEPVSVNPTISFGSVNQTENNNNPDLVSTPQTRAQERVERMNRFGLGEDFPHFDIIYNLLEEDPGHYRESLEYWSSRNLEYWSSRNLLPPRAIFPLDITGMSPESVAAYMNAYRFDRDYDEDGYQLGYGSSYGHFDSLDLQDNVPQMHRGLYLNEPIDGLMRNQWPMNGGDLAYYRRTNGEYGSYPYNFLEYENPARRMMDYTAFRPYNAH